ncbi:LysM peptidoglycan-binding domain-containing protein [Cellulomonas dongxiuzhuiae]|uniref:LysM peptidoglycan-binding domain-containing protein n=1 Tax=Cellulomonas dongxiuzhuiae TaxID=2819979 RepID=UPI0020371C0E|nr:LysM domain-containing protein [Cellulomonas dongxiuzhuiae]
MPDRPRNLAGRPPHPAATAVGLVLAGTAALAVAAALGLWVADHVASTQLWRVETVVAPLVVAVGALAAAWVGVSALVAGACAAVRSAGGAWRGGEAAVHRWAPGLVRRALAVALAAGVGLTGVVGAHATADAPPDAVVVTVDLGWTPTATDLAPPSGGDAGAALTGAGPSETVPPDAVPAGAATSDAPPADETPPPVTPDTHTEPGRAADVVPVVAQVPAVTEPAPAAPPAGRVEVHPGDTLWGLAARALGPGASDAAIAAEWPRWYAANAATIGPDPDVLQPGQVLVVPSHPDGGAR